MLHIHNGDASADVARTSAIPGEHFAFREALVEGPTPANRDTAEWRKLRAQHLAEAYGEDLDRCERELEAQDEELKRSNVHDEVVLWFEHDLFCQVNLLYLLQWFAQQQPKAKLSLVCIVQFPGKDNFRGLGELNAEQLASLFPSRRLVTQEQLTLAQSAWDAYCSRDPTDIQSLLETDTVALPFLRPALLAHLQRFPSTRNGLGRIENCALQLVTSGVDDFGELFRRFQDAEPRYGLGDAQFRLALRRLIEAGQPLLNAVGTDVKTTQLDPTMRYEITELGKSVLAGQADFVNLNGIQRWLGGVYLEDDRAVWRWDDQAEKLVFS